MNNNFGIMLTFAVKLKQLFVKHYFWRQSNCTFPFVAMALEAKRSVTSFNHRSSKTFICCHTHTLPKILPHNKYRIIKNRYQICFLHLFHQFQNLYWSWYVKATLKEHHHHKIMSFGLVCTFFVALSWTDMG